MLASSSLHRIACLALLTCSALLAIACQPKPTDIPGPSQSWDSMAKPDRELYMTTTVLPHMRETFVGFDAERFAAFDCETCHVTGAATGDYAMPDPGIPKLSRLHFGRDHQRKHPETVRFMWEQVEPEMSALLGGPEGTRGFNCRTGHQVR
jgi:hypothetical protein